MLSQQSLQEEVTRAQQVALMLDDRIKEDGHRMDALATLVNRSVTDGHVG